MHLLNLLAPLPLVIAHGSECDRYAARTRVERRCLSLSRAREKIENAARTTRMRGDYFKDT
jgi:hypothetical protein